MQTQKAPVPLKAIVLDLDDTLWIWREAYAIAIYAMLAALIDLVASKQFHERELINLAVHKCFEAVMKGTKYYEHPTKYLPALLESLDQLLPYSLPKSQFEHESLVKSLDRLFNETFDQHHTVHEDVTTVLRSLRAKRLRLIAYSNAHFDKVVYRLSRTGLGPHFHLVAARMPSQLPTTHQAQGLNLVANWNASSLLLADNECKPHQPTLHRLAKSVGVKVEECLFIGDSSFDVDPPAELGLRTLHATSYNPTSEDAVARLKKYGFYVNHAPNLPHQTITHFKQVLDHV